MKTVKTVGAIVGAIVVTGVIFLFIYDFGSYKPEVEAAASKATGRDFRINGELSIKLLPSPTIRMTDASLANAGWADEPSMLEISEMSATVGLWSLLSGPILIKDLQLHDVVARLETNDAGESNTDFDVAEEEPSAEEEEAAPSSEPPIVVDNADISNIDVVMSQPASDDIQFLLDSLTVTIDADGQKAIVGSASLLDRPITLDGIAAEERAELNATFGNIQITSVTQHRGTEADVDITISRLTDIGEVLAIANLPAEDLTMSGNVAYRNDDLLLNNVTLGVATAKLVIDGRLLGAAGAELELRADVPSLAVFGNDLPDIPLNGSASVALTPTSTQIEPFTATFGESDIAGSFTREGVDNPRLTLDAQSKFIDLRPFSEEPEGDAEEPKEDAEAVESKEETAPYVFAEEPLPLEMLRALNAHVDVTIDRVQGRTLQLKNVAVTFDASDGDVKFESKVEGDRSGALDNKVELRAGETNAEITINSHATDLKLGVLSGDDIPDEQVPTTEFKLDIAASGASPRQLASSVNGQILLTSGPGRIKNDLIGRGSGDIFARLFSALNPFAKEEKYSNWECTILAIDFESGEGEMSGFLLQGEKIMVVGGGGVDLNTEKLNIEFNTKPREGVGVSAEMFVTPFVKLSGTLAKPGVGLNEKGLLLEGGLAVATAGLSFFYKGFADRATAQAGRCEEVMAEVAKN